MLNNFAFLPCFASYVSTGRIIDDAHRFAMLNALIPLKWIAKGDDLAEVEALYLEIISAD